MQLVEVDPVGLQALEAGIQGSGDVLAVVLKVAAADMADAVARAGDLARQDPVGTVAAPGEPVADDGFGGAVGFSARWHRIHLGGIHEVDAVGLGPLDLSEGFGLGVLLAPGHRAQAKAADLEVGAAKLAVFHRCLLRLRKRPHEIRLIFFAQSA
ncbi:hypothetical protein FQZ97_1015560 [compost metagenome]